MAHGEWRRQTLEQQGFLLTRHWRDTPDGTEVDLWVATAEGARQLRLPLQTSVAFIPLAQKEQAELILRGDRDADLRPLSLLDFQHRPVFGLYCRQYRQSAASLEKRLREHGVDVYEADVRPPERYLMERFITRAGDVRRARQSPHEPGLLVDAHVLKPLARLPPNGCAPASLDIETTHGRRAALDRAWKAAVQRVVYMLGPPNGVDASTLDFDLRGYCDSRGQCCCRRSSKLWYAGARPGRHHRLERRAVRPAGAAAAMPSAWDKMPLRTRPRRQRPSNGARAANGPGARAHFFAAVAGPARHRRHRGAANRPPGPFRRSAWSTWRKALLGEGKAIDNPYDRMASKSTAVFAEDKPALAPLQPAGLRAGDAHLCDKSDLMPFLLERAQRDGPGRPIAAAVRSPPSNICTSR